MQSSRRVVRSHFCIPHLTLRPLPRLIKPQPPLDLPVSQPQPLHAERQRQWRNNARHDGLEDQRAPHVARRIIATPRPLAVAVGHHVHVPLLQRVHDDDEDAAEQLAAGPADGGADFRRRGPGDLDEVLERDGYEAEGCGAQDGSDDVGRRERAGLGRENEGEVGERDDGD